jgi:hypothetical protein
MSEVRYLAIDPGDTTGWAEFNETGDLTGFGQVKEHEFNDFVTEHMHSDLTAVIVEDYKLFAHKAKAQSWSRMSTSKKIGKIEILADLKKVKVILQPANNKSIGYMWGGIEPPSNHSISHQYDAYAHGVFWLQKNGIRKPGQGIKALEGNPTDGV